MMKVKDLIKTLRTMEPDDDIYFQSEHDKTPQQCIGIDCMIINDNNVVVIEIN